MKRSQRKLCACRNYRSDLRGVLEGGTREKEGWRDLMTDLMRNGRLGLRVTSRPGVPQGKGYPTGMQGFKKE